MKILSVISARSPEKGLDKAIALTIFGVVLSAMIYCAVLLVAEPDLWGHMQFGEDIWRSHQIYLHNPYSYLTANVKWINHEWLSEMLMGACYDQLGVPGLILLKSLLVLAITFLLLIVITDSGFGTLSGNIFFLAVTCLLYRGLAVLRPHLFTYLFFTITCVLLKKAGQQVTKVCWFLPLLFVFWANTHGGYLMGLMVLLIWGVIETFEAILIISQRSFLLPKWLWIGCSFLATIINPYGWELHSFLVNSFLARKVTASFLAQVAEWHPISITEPEGLIYLIVVAVLVSSLFFCQKRNQSSLIIILLIMAMAPLIAVRHLPLFAITTIVFGADYIHHMLSKIGTGFSFTQFSNLSKAIILSCSLSTIAVIIFRAEQNWGKVVIPVDLKLPTKATFILKEVKAEGNLANFYDWGQYLIWHLSPHIKVSLDALEEMNYPNSIYLENLAFMYGIGPWDTVIEKHPTDMVLFSKDFATFNLMKFKRHWVLVYEDAVSGLFIRDSSPLLLPIKQYIATHSLPSEVSTSFP